MAAPLTRSSGVLIEYKRLDGHLDAFRLLPLSFTAITSILFGACMWLLLRVTADPALFYFHTHWYWGMTLIPAAITGVHVVHTRQGKPTKYTLAFGIILPSLILLFYGNLQYMSAFEKTTKLSVSDCGAFIEKRDLQRSWEAAHRLYMSCINDTHVATGHPRDVLLQRFRLPDCEEYEGALYGDGYHKEAHVWEWTYLQRLEEEEMCAGWCYQGRQLWSHKKGARDACSKAVARVFASYASPRASQVLSMMLVVLASIGVVTITLGPVMQKYGMEW